VRRVVVSWNDARRAVLTAAPWDATINIPEGQLGILRAVAELDDGRNSEDAVLLNAGGMVGQADVQLVELPITVVSRTGITPEITADRITVREGKTVRRVESVAGAAETPLTVGLLIDVSDSMQRTLPDLQEAAIRFLETALGERDRAFLVTFDSSARLLQPATSDVALLRRQIMKIRPNGMTALHDAMVLGLLQFEGIKGRRAMIVFTDGLDRTSEYTAAEVSELARRANVPVHVFASLSYSPYAGGTWIASPSNPDLQRIAQTTGGTAHILKDLAELPAIYARIEAALRAQILAFVRTDPGTRENEWRSIKVQVSGPDLDVFAPEGYYAAW
jgi:VWFA-related protein